MCVVASVLWYTNQVGCFYLYAYSECVSVNSVIQHSILKAHAPCYIVVCGLSGPIILSTLPHKQHDFREKFIEHKSVFLFPLKPFF